MSNQLYSRFPALLSQGTPIDPATSEYFAPGIHWGTGKTFKTGARPSPRHALANAVPHRSIRATPSQVAYCPKQLNVWGNDNYGDCVTAEEAYAKACYGLDGQGDALVPEIFIPSQTVINWASRNGYLNGADLSSVMDSMQRGGFVVGSQTYNDGPYTSVDWTNEAILQSAIASGPVKIAIAASVLPSGAGNQQGWYITGNHGGINRTDHCVSIGGFGPAGWLVQQLNAVYGNVSLPSGLSASTIMYLVYTWATLGLVDFAWLGGTVPEAWLRNPTTVGVPALPPLPSPTPPTPPTPTGWSISGGQAALPFGEYPVGDPNNPAGMLWVPGGLPAGASYPVNVLVPPLPD